MSRIGTATTQASNTAWWCTASIRRRCGACPSPCAGAPTSRNIASRRPEIDSSVVHCGRQRAGRHRVRAPRTDCQPTHRDLEQPKREEPEVPGELSLARTNVMNAEQLVIDHALDRVEKAPTHQH